MPKVNLRFLLLLACAAAVRTCMGQTLDTIGVTALRAQDATLTGSGVIVIQVESTPDPTNPLEFEVTPSFLGQPESLFTYISTKGVSIHFPNTVGIDSNHADQVAQNFYGNNAGVATGVRHVAVAESNWFLPAIIGRMADTTGRVINQSFGTSTHSAPTDQAYDNYIAAYRPVIVSAVGDGGPVHSPGDCYNGIGAGAYGGGTSIGPTADGRCKPDLVAPASATSFSTPLISGAAAILIQAGRRLGVNATAATDCRTVKALLLDGADKPSGWSNSPTQPLDYTYGAGMLDVFNSYNELQGGRFAPSLAMATPLAQDHPPLVSGTAIDSAAGWDLRAIGSNAARDGACHYLLATSGTLTATLVWDRERGRATVNHLQLSLYNLGGSPVASSVSAVDNVQHLHLTALTPGTYDLEVVKPGGSGLVSAIDGYALVWDTTH